MRFACRNIECDVMWLIAIRSVVVQPMSMFGSLAPSSGKGQARLGRAQTLSRRVTWPL
jgi:hypothetical protein